MHTIELLEQVRPNQPLVIPPELLTQYIGAHARVVIYFEPPQTETVDDELLSLVQSIQALPERSDLVRPSTSIDPDVVERILQEDVSDTVSNAWNEQWAVYEEEIGREYDADEQQFIETLTP